VSPSLGRGLLFICRIPFLTLIALGALIVWTASLVDERLQACAARYRISRSMAAANLARESRPPFLALSTRRGRAA
jgi:hypothetical protein